MIRKARREDCSAIAEIYNYYIEHTSVTFEETPINATDIEKRLETVLSAGHCWLVSKSDTSGSIEGYAYSSKWRERSAYRYSAEISVYLHRECTARGLGSQLYQELFKELKNRGIRIVIGGVTLPNEPSVALHAKFGMHKVAHFEKVGFKFGNWLDVAYWQIDLGIHTH